MIINIDDEITHDESLSALLYSTLYTRTLLYNIGLYNYILY